MVIALAPLVRAAAFISTPGIGSVPPSRPFSRAQSGFVKGISCREIQIHEYPFSMVSDALDTFRIEEIIEQVESEVPITFASLSELFVDLDAD